MTTLSKALGAGFISHRQAMLTREFDLGGHTFKVRIPLVAESDAIYQRISAPDEGAVETVFNDLTKNLEQFKDAPNSELKFEGDDILVSGRSMREAARNKVMTEARIVEFVKLLIPAVDGATLDELTYADIEEEFPLAVQILLVEKIAEAISPNYKDTRKN